MGTLKLSPTNLRSPLRTPSMIGTLSSSKSSIRTPKSRNLYK